MSEQLTDWYPADVKPLRNGVYLTDASYKGSDTYQYWNGDWWGLFMPTKDGALRDRHEKSSHQYASWRGLASDPNA